MNRKINNKGMTIVEILVTFVIVATIVVSMYISIINLQNRERIASAKNSITTYHDLIIKKVEDDLIIKDVKDVNYDEENKKLTFKFKDYPDTVLEIKENSVKMGDNPKLCTANNTIYDEIIYDKESYKVPIIGGDGVEIPGVGCRKVSTIRITGVEYEAPSASNYNIMSLKIKLFHPDLGDKYSINIITPVGYK